MVSIVIPLYNSEKFIDATLESCLNQTYKNIEIIVVDDCSSDKSVEIVKKKMAGEKRIQLLMNEKNSGFIKSMNRGIKASKGEYIIGLGNDDILEPTHVEIMRSYFEKDDISFAYCKSNYIDENGNKIGESRTLDIATYDFLLTKQNIINSCGLMMSREKLKAAGLYPEFDDFPNYGEWYLWILMLKEAEAIFVENVKSNYRIHSANLTKTFLNPDKLKGTKKYNLMCMKLAYDKLNLSLTEKIKFYVNYYIYILKMNYHIYIKRG